ncbi:VCBS repeat-containing protein [Sphingopyxis indica]|uniref:VCBS repeat-containing protein n=2 Tax=Sphingopyxis indica TaxID=436663 RepID=A0A239K3N2_9SPHN|nr:VCBS repeat-containing protein [Sphingopyxis indica]
MDAFDNVAKSGRPAAPGAEPDTRGSQAIADNGVHPASAGVTATAAAIPLAIQAMLVPDAGGRIILPPGVSIDDIGVSGPDLIIALPDGQILVIPNGAIDIPAIVVDGDIVPASTVAQLLENLQDFNPEAGVRSSGGNFAEDEGTIGDPYAIGNLLPYTELNFPEPEDREVIPAIPDSDEEPTISIVTPDQPAGSVDATASVDEAGLPARDGEPAGSNSAADGETTSGSIRFDAPDGLSSVTINGVAVSAVGQVFSTPFGQLVITAINAGSIDYSYTLLDNSDAAANPADLFTVVVTDSDGDTATANLTISIIDDAPVARADTDTVAAATFTAETGNVISGEGTDSGAAGADTPGADGVSLTGAAAGTGTTFSAPGTAIHGQYGTLTIDAQGNYSYVRDTNTPGGVSDIFTYQLTDGDGDTSTATLTIAIGDSPSVIDFVPGQGDGTVVDEAHLPPRGGETQGSAFDGTDETTSGTIGFTSPDGVASVTINGVVVTPGSLPQTISSDGTGTLVIDAYSYDPATGKGSISYTYSLSDNTADPDGTTVSFDIVVTDLDGDMASDVLDITIVDDVPTAFDDADSVTEDGPLVADGNVLTGTGGSDANATDGVADTQGADGASVTAVAGGSVGTSFATAYGTLTLNADGSYTYVLDNAAQPVQGLSAGETLTENFDYTITDGDGDTATATLTITINGADDGVTISGLDAAGGELAFDEDDLPGGSSPDAAALTQSGSFDVSTPDGLGDVTIGGVQVVANGVFTAVTVTSSLGTVNITGFTPVTGADGSVIGGSFTYEYVLSDNTLMHGAAGEDGVTDSFAVVVTDSDGSAANASLDITIVDDVPIAFDDADSVTEDGPLVADGNVLTGTGGSDANATDGVADTQGADGASVTAVAGGSVGTSFATAYGTLTLNADGSYTYVLDNAAQPVQGLSAGETLTENFDYTITDGDGDTATATLTITINGADDGVTISGLDAVGGELAFDEDDLAVRGSEPAGSDTTPDAVNGDGAFSVSTPDGMGTVVLDSFNGSPITPLTLVDTDGSFIPQTVSTSYGSLAITGFTPVIGADGSVIGGTFTYSYILGDNRLDHASAGQDSLADSIGVTVTDSDGSNAGATIDIVVTDDVPTAIDDALVQSVENQPVTINVLANDVQGADGVQPAAVSIVAGSLSGGGVLVNNGDGSFTYTQAPGEVGDVSFQYQITDGDGDTSTATATITLIADSMPIIRSAANVTVDEDGLVGANLDDGLPGEVTSTGSNSATGTIVVDFGGDVPPALTGSIVLNDAAALDTQLTVDGNPVTFAKDGADLVGSVGGSEVIRISLTGATAGPGATEVTYNYSVTLAQAVDQAAPGSEDSDILSGIGFTVTDSDGSSGSGSFDVTVIDDIPTLLVSDTPTHAVEGGPAVDGSWSLDAGADGVSSVVVTFGSGSAALSLTPGSSVTIGQSTGVLTVRADGTFSFAAAGDQDNSLNPAASFTLSAVDGDGDPTSDTLTILIDDGAAPSGGDTLTLTVDEAALDAGGSTPLSNAEVASGTLDFTAGSDTLSGFAFTGVDGLVANLDGAGSDIFWSLSPDGQTITGSLTSGGPAAITISLSAPASIAPGATEAVTVTVTLADNLPHELAMAAQTQALGSVTVQGSDTDGDIATGAVTVQVADDIPTATAEALQSLDEGATITGTFDFAAGADGASLTHVNGGAVSFNPDGWSGWIDLGDGELRVRADGSYEFRADAATLSPVAPIAGTFTVTDGDGDTASAGFSFQIDDANAPTGGTASAAVDDDGLAGGNPASVAGDLDANAGDDPGDTSEASFTGTLGGSVGGDGAGANGFGFGTNTSATIGLETVTYSLVGNVLTATVSASPDAGRVGTALFTVEITDPATGAYKVTLLDNVLHAGGPNDEGTDATATIAYSITDADGSTVPGNSLTITFDDDAPSATAEALQSLDEGTTLTGTFDFAAGADGASLTHVNGGAVSFNPDGWSGWIDLGDGELRVRADGSYEFRADAATLSPVAPIAGTFTVTDGDGDTASAGFSFQIDDANAPTGGTASAAVDDDGLAGGNPASVAGDLDANAGDDPGDTSEASFTGTLGGSVGGDGAGANGFGFGTNTSATIGLETVTYSLVGNVLTATVSASPDAGRVGTALFTVEITDPATGAYKVTLLDNVLHAGGPNDEGTDATATIAYSITDADGSTVPGNSLTITFDDDAPTLAETAGPEMLTLTNAVGSASGSFDAAFGADGASYYHITGPTIEGITYTETNIVDGSGDFLRTELLAETSDGTDVFRMTVHADGNYEFDLITPNAATQESISFANLSAGGPSFRELDDDPNTALNEAGRVEFQSNGSGVNASDQGFGVNNQWTDHGEWFELEFHDPGNFGVNDAPQTNADLLDSITLNVQQVKFEPVDFEWTATRYNPDGTVAATETGTFAVNSAGQVTIDPSIQFSVLRIENIDTNEKATARFATDVTVARTILPPDVTYDFTVVGTDGDGDTSNPLQISVFIDEPSVPPLALDLDGDGVEFVSRSAGISFDYFGDGERQNTAWVGPDDGLLAIDANGNGMVDGGSEIVFGGNGLTDLEGLAVHYDSNEDGVLDRQDDAFPSFGVWQDANSNGVTDEGEFRSLVEAGIVSISLESDGRSYTTAQGDVRVYGETSYTLEDGTVRVAADSAFAYSKAPVVEGTATRSPERTGGTAPVADALVAASLVTMVQAAGQAEHGAPAPLVHDQPAQIAPLPALPPVAEAQEGVLQPRLATAFERIETRGEAPANDHALRTAGDEGPIHRGIEDNASDASLRVDAQASAGDHASDALFDMAAPRIALPSTAMDGLIALRAATPDIAAKVAGADADPAAAARVLAEAIDHGSVDKLIDAIVDGQAHDAHASDAKVDLAQMLEANVTSEMAMFVHQPIEHDLHQLASA